MTALPLPDLFLLLAALVAAGLFGVLVAGLVEERERPL
jgi:hypothetical protein